MNWQAHKSAIGNHWIIMADGAEPYSGEGDEVCISWSKQAEAHAHLIAAAPRLLASLKWAMQWLDSDNWSTQQMVDYNAALAVIKEAEGDS